MKMNYNRILSYVLILLCLSACKSDEISDAKPRTELLNVEKEIAFAATESSWTVKIRANCHWEVSSVENSEWDELTVSPRSGDGDGMLTLTTTQNHYSVDRTATVLLVTTGGIQQNIMIHQTKSGADLSINHEEFSFDDQEGTQSLVVSCNTNWEILGTTGVDWLELGQTSGGSGTIEVPIKVKEVLDDSNRSATLTISAGNVGDNKLEFRVVQSGKSVIELKVSPEEPSAFSPEGGEQSLKVSCNAAWRAFIPSTAQQWLHIEPESGVGDGEIHITCDSYTVTKNDRLTMLIVTAGSQNLQQCEVIVQQTAALPDELSEEDNPNPQLSR